MANTHSKKLDPPSRFNFSNGSMKCRVCGWKTKRAKKDELQRIEYEHVFGYGKNRCHWPGQGLR